MKPTFKRAKDWQRFYWVIFDTCVRREYYLDLHNLLAQPVGSTIRYNYRKAHCTEACWTEIEKGTIGHDVLLVYTQFEGFKRGDNVKCKERFPPGSRKWHCPTRLARMAGITVNGDQVFFDLLLGDYPKPSAPAFGELMQMMEAKDTVPFNKLADIESGRGFGWVESPDPYGNKENWSAIATELDQHSQFHGDSFWRIAGPFRRKSNQPIPSKRLVLRHDSIQQLVFRDSEVAYFQIQNQESRSKIQSADAPTRSLKISVSEPALQIRDTALPLRQYFESTVFFRAKKQESIRPSESVIEFSTDGEPSKFPVGASFKLPYTVNVDRRKTTVGCIAAFFGAILATIALKEKLTYLDVGIFAGALILLSGASVLLHDKIRIGSGGD